MGEMGEHDLVLRVAHPLVRREPPPRRIRRGHDGGLHGQVGDRARGHQVALGEEGGVVAVVGDGHDEALPAAEAAAGEAEAVVEGLGVEEEAEAVVHAAAGALDPGPGANQIG